MRVPQVDLRAQYLALRDEVIPALEGVCTNASFVSGEEVTRFEDAFADYCSARHCVALNSGTSALHLALLACGIQNGDEVVTAANTFIATAEAISYTGATPIFADIDPTTGNIDPKSFESAITDRTKAIVPVHLYGRPAQLVPILDIADRNQLAVIEDACQAHGARYGGKRVGAFGIAAAFSFYPTKNLGAFGQGGALTTDDESIARYARKMADHGRVQGYAHDAIGFNYRMDGLQGATLAVKLRHLDGWNAKRRQRAAEYRERLRDVRVNMPQDRAQDECVYHQFVVWADNRDEVRRSLSDRGVETAVHYPIPLHLQEAYAPLGHRKGAFPHAELTCDRAISLPMFPQMSAAQVDYVASTLRDVVGTA